MAVLVTGRPGMQVLGSSWDNWPPVATSSFYVQETPVHAGQSGAVSPERLLLTGSAVGIWEGCFFTVRGCPLRCRLLHPLNATPPPTVPCCCVAPPHVAKWPAGVAGPPPPSWEPRVTAPSLQRFSWRLLKVQICWKVTSKEVGQVVWSKEKLFCSSVN